MNPAHKKNLQRMKICLSHVNKNENKIIKETDIIARTVMWDISYHVSKFSMHWKFIKLLKNIYIADFKIKLKKTSFFLVM